MLSVLFVVVVAVCSGILLGTMLVGIEVWWRDRKRRAAQRDGRTERDGAQDRSGAASASGN